MISCPNKNTKEWKELSAAIGAKQAMLAFIRNGDQIPSEAEARELLTNKGLLEGLRNMPMLSQETVFSTLQTNNLLTGSPIQDRGKTWYQLADREDVAEKLGQYTNEYGPVLEYDNGYVTVAQDSIDKWNEVAQLKSSKQMNATELAEEFLDRIGVPIQERSDVLARHGSNGVANMAEKMVEIQSGMKDVALPEEALHFFLEMLPQDHPALLEALDKIRNKSVYGETLEQYKNNPNYQVDGKPNFTKIKKEALAKELASRMKSKDHGWLSTLIDGILNFIKSLTLQKTAIEKLEDLFYSKDISLLNMNLNSSELYNQLADETKSFYEAQSANEAQKKTLDAILAHTAAINFDKSNHILTHHATVTSDGIVMRSVTQVLGSDFYSELDHMQTVETILDNFEQFFPDIIGEDSPKIKNYIDSVSGKKDEEELIKKYKAKVLLDYFTEKLLNDTTKETVEDLLKVLPAGIAKQIVQASQNKQKTLFGTAVHTIVESIIMDKEIDLDNLDPIIYQFMDKKTLMGLIYGKGLKDTGIRGLIQDLQKDGSVLMSEVEVGNGTVGGVIDLIAIRPDGTAEVYDFKTKFLREHKFNQADIKAEFEQVTRELSKFGIKKDPAILAGLADTRRSLNQKYTQQLSLYKNLLMEAGIRVGGLHIIGVPYRTNAEGKVTEVKAFVADPISYNDKIGSYLFNIADKSMDASKKSKKMTIEDERTKLLDDISNDSMKESFTKALTRLQQLYEHFKKNKNINTIYDLLTDKTSKTNRVDTQRDLVRTILNNFENFDDATKFLNVQKGFLELIDSSVGIIQTVAKEFDRLRKLKAVDEKSAVQRINELQKVNDFVTGYETMFKEMLGHLDSADLDNPLVKRLADMIGITTSIKSQYVDSIFGDVTDIMLSEFSPDDLENMRRLYTEDMIAAKQRGDEKLTKMYEERIKNLPSKESIAEVIKGNRGDVGWFWGKFVATISNPDIILSSVAKRLKAVLDRVRLMNKEFKDNLSVEFDKRAKLYGRGLDIKKINESLVYEAKEFNASTGKEMNVSYFKSEYHEKLYADYNKLKYNLKQAEEEKDVTKIKAAKLAIKNFEQKYFESNFTNEYFKLTSVLDKEVTHAGNKTTIRELIADIYDKINAVQRRGGYSDEDISSGNMTDEDLQERMDLFRQISSLKESNDENGLPKTGEALKIAEALKEYDKNKELLYDYVELTDLFNHKQQEMKLKYGEGSEEYEAWMAKNTRLAISDEYYTRRQQILDRIKEINNNDEASVKMDELYRELSVLAKPYKDADGYIRGQNMPADVAQKIKRIEAEIVTQRQNLDNFIMNGNTAAEKEEINQINFLKYNDKAYDRERLNELIREGKNRLQDRIDNDPDYAEKYDEMTDLLNELYKMGKTEITEYYYEELDKQRRNFAEANNVTYEEFMNNPEMYEDFEKSEWFINNHNIIDKIVYEDPETGETLGSKIRNPIWSWKRNMPIDKYITRKPANHFYQRTLKESYTDANGKEVLLKNTDNKDVQGRFKPKNAEQYKKEYGKEHPYLNKDFTSLRDKYTNGTASEKEKVDYENLLFIHKSMLDAQEGIEVSQRLGLAVPFLEKHGRERTIESRGNNFIEKGNSIWQGIKRSVTSTEQDVDQEGIHSSKTTEYSHLATMDNNEYKFVPVRYSTKGEADNASYDVWGGVLNYVAATNRKKELDQEMAMLNGLEKMLGDERNQPKSEANNLIANKIFKKYLPDMTQKINSGTNTRLEVLKSFVNSVMFNEESFKGYEMLGVNSQKVVNKMMRMISFTTLGFAPFNWMTNLLSGHVQNIVEAVGGNTITLNGYKDAKNMIYMGSSKYGTPIKDMMNDYSKVGNKSFWGQIMEYFDPIQGEVDDEYGHKTSFNKFANILHAGVYAGKMWGEWEIQMSTFIAYMLNNKVSDGKVVDRESFITKHMGDISDMSIKEISAKKLEAIKAFDALEHNLLDLFEMKDGKLVVKAQFKDVFELGSKDFSNVVAKLHSMQKRINGSYNKFDKTYIEKTSLGKMATFFRKHVIPLGVNRLGTLRENYESMSTEEGFYITFCKTMGKDLMHFRLQNIINWENYSDREKRAIKRTLTDVGIILTCMAAYTLIGGYNENDKDKMKKLRRTSWANQAMVFELLKLKSETEQFIPAPDMGLNELKRLYSNPSLILSETTQMFYMTSLLAKQAAHAIPGSNFFENDLYYQKDTDQGGLGDKGDSKLLHELVRSFSGYSGKTFHPADAVKSFEYGQRIK